MFTTLTQRLTLSLGLTLSLFALLPSPGEALPKRMLNLGDAQRCYVTASDIPGDGSKQQPYNSLAAVEADPNCEVILVKPYNVEKAYADSTVLDGGIRLKPGQRLLGLGPDVSKKNAEKRKRRPYITNRNEEDSDFFGPLNLGAGVIMAQDSEVAGVHIGSTWNGAILVFNVSGAKVHRTLITDANVSADPYQFGAFGPTPAAAIMLVASINLGTVEIGLPAPTSLELSDTIIRRSQQGIYGVTTFIPALPVPFPPGFILLEPSPLDLVVDNVTIEQMSSQEPLPRAQSVGGIWIVAASSQAKLILNNSKFREIDNVENNVAGVLLQSFFDGAVIDFSMHATSLKNKSSRSETFPDLPKGDWLTFGATTGGATVNYEISDVTVENSGQDGLEPAIEYQSPLLGGGIFPATGLPMTTGSVERAIITGNGRYGAVPIAIYGSADAPTGGTLEMTMSESLITGNGSESEFYSNLGQGVDTAGLAIGVADQARAGIDSSDFTFNIDLGSPNGSIGQNCIFDNVDVDVRLVRLGTPEKPIFISAENNYWGSSSGLGASQIDQSASPNVVFDADPFLEENPKDRDDDDCDDDDSDDDD